jgi:hypothetical protein
VPPVQGRAERFWGPTLYFPHDSLCPLNRSGDHRISPRTALVLPNKSSAVFRCRATRISATIASTRSRPSSTRPWYQFRMLS